MFSFVHIFDQNNNSVELQEINFSNTNRAHKRKGETGDLGAYKVQKLEESSPWLKILNNKDLMTLILSYLPIQSALSFERVCSRHQMVTGGYWKQMRTQDHFDFNWQAMQKEFFVDKWSYVAGKILLSYSIKKYDLLSVDRAKQVQTIDKILTTYQAVLKRRCFAAIKDYLVEERLFWQGNLQTEDINGQREIIKEKAEEGWAGELLLQGLFIYQKFRRVVPFPKEYLSIVAYYFSRAIKKKAAWASLLLPRSIEFSTHQMDLALQGAEQGDYQALSRLPQYNLENLARVSKLNYPPILAALAYIYLQDKDFKKAEILFDHAFKDKDYGNQAPARVVVNAALTKLKLEQWHQANILFTKALSLYGNQAPSDVVANAALTKLELQQWHQADTLFTEALNLYGNQAPTDVVTDAAFTKLKLSSSIDLYSNLNS